MTALAEVLLPEPVIRMPSDPTWRTRGTCQRIGVNVSNFWSDDPQAIAAAKRICDACPVQIECLDYALAMGESFGVWGGVDENERRRVARGVHGTPERYRARRCRCEPCTDAYARAKALQRDVEVSLAEALSGSMVQ